MESAAATEAVIDEAPPLTFGFSDAVVAINDPASIQAESLRSLRSNLLAQHVKRGRRSLAVCAPSANTGCTYVSLNIAATMAQAGLDTLLIDGNLRNPSIQDHIVPSHPLPGLAECLADDAMPLSRALAVVQPNLSVLYAGNVEGSTFNRLSSPVFRGLMDQCLRDFDLTIIDTPPSNSFSDARRIASVVRYAMVVSCRDRSFVSDINALLTEIASDGGQVVGLYLNDY